MAALLGLQTGSIVDNANGTDRTGTGLSTNIVMKVNGIAIGALQRVQIRENRTISRIDEIGTDGTIDSVPSKSTEISGSASRIRYDRMRIAEAFDRGFIHVHSQRLPFDLDIFDNWNGDGSNAIITTVRNCWIQSISYQYQQDNFVITDEMEFVAEAIYSTLNGSNASTGGSRSIPLQISSTERLADVGAYRGTLSVPGLISDVFSS